MVLKSSEGPHGTTSCRSFAFAHMNVQPRCLLNGHHLPHASTWPTCLQASTHTDGAEALGAAASLCPLLQKLGMGEAGCPFTAQPLQQMACLRSLQLGVTFRDLQSALHDLAMLSQLQELHLSTYHSPGHTSHGDDDFVFVDCAALGQLQGLQRLRLLFWEKAIMRGLPAIAMGCAQLSYLDVCVQALDVSEGAFHGAAPDPAPSGAAPWWPSLEQASILLIGEDENQPGCLAAFHLDCACKLREISSIFDSIDLLHGCPESSPGALHGLCYQLAALPAGLRPTWLSLSSKW